MAALSRILCIFLPHGLMGDFIPVWLHLVFGVNGCADNRATYPSLTVAERYRVTGCRGVLGATKSIAGRVLGCGAGLEPAGLGAEHLDYAAGHERNPWGKRCAVGECAGHDQHDADDCLKYPGALAPGDHWNHPYFPGSAESQLGFAYVLPVAENCEL